MMRYSALCAAVACLTVSAAQAAVITGPVARDFSAAPFSFDFGGGNAITFTLVDPAFFALNPTGVSTSGTVQVLSLGAPFFNPPQPTSFFTDRGGSIGPDSLGVYVGYAAPAPVPFSLSEGIVGLRFDIGRGWQYATADVQQGYLYGLQFETRPGVAIAIQPIRGPSDVVPEPASWAMLIAGFGLTGAAARRRRGTPLPA